MFSSHIRTASGSNTFIAVACTSGVYLARRGESCTSRLSFESHICVLINLSAFRKVLSVPNPTSMVALAAAGKLFVLHEDGLCSYSLDMLARAALGLIDSRKVDATREIIAGDVLFFRAGRVGNRFMGV